MSQFSRRQIVRFIGGAAAFLYGKPASAGQLNVSQYAQMSRAASRIVLVLDGTDGVEVVYRGQRITVPPQEIMDALRSK